MKVSADDIAQLLASTPPRRVPDNVAKAALRGRSGWGSVVFAVIFGGMGLLFTWAFFPWELADEWRLAADAARTTPGLITAVNRTNTSVNKTRVMAYDFSYTTDDGKYRQGRCYTTGPVWRNNAAVTVRYLPADPDLACVQGARLGKVGWGGAFVIIFPLIGGGMVFWFVMSGRRTRRLLQEGVVTEVDVVSVDATNTRINNQTLYRIVFGGNGLPGGAPLSIRRVNPREISLALKSASTKQPVFILYDPVNPKRLLIPEALITDAAS